MANERKDADPILLATPEEQVLILKKRFAELRESKHKRTTATSNYNKIIDVLGNNYSVEDLDSDEEYDLVGTPRDAVPTHQRANARSLRASIEKPPAKDTDEAREEAAREEWIDAVNGAIEGAEDDTQGAFPHGEGDTDGGVHDRDGAKGRGWQYKHDGEEAAPVAKKRSRGKGRRPTEDKKQRAERSASVYALKDTIGQLEARVRNQQVVIKGLSEKIQKETYNNPLKFNHSDLLHGCSMVPPPLGTGELAVAFVIIEMEGLSERAVRSDDIETAHRDVQQILSKVSCDYGGYCQGVDSEERVSVWAFEEPEHAVEWALTCQTLQGNLPAKSPAHGLRLRIGIDKGVLEREVDPLTGEGWLTGPAWPSASDLAADCPRGVTNISVEVYAALGEDALQRVGNPHLLERVDSTYLFAKGGAAQATRTAQLIKRVAEGGSPDASKKYMKMMREPAGMPLEWRPEADAKDGGEWPPRGEVTMLCVVVDKYPQLENSIAADAKAALKLCWNEMRRVLKENNGYESRVERNVFVAAFKTPQDALAAALMAQQTMLYLEWPEAVTQHAASKTVSVGNMMVLKGLRLVMGLHTCSTHSRIDPLTGRHWYFGREAVMAPAVTSVGLGGEIIVTEKTTKALQAARVEASRQMGHPEMNLVRPVVVEDFPDPVQCYEASNDHLKHRRAYCGRGIARDSSQSMEYQQRIQALERRVRQLEAENASKASEIEVLVSGFNKRVSLPDVLMSPKAGLVSRTVSMHTVTVTPLAMPASDPLAMPSPSLRTDTILDKAQFTRNMQQQHQWNRTELARWNTFVVTSVDGAKHLRSTAVAFNAALGMMLDCMTAMAVKYEGKRVAHCRDTNMYLFADVENAVKWAAAVQCDLYCLTWPDALNGVDHCKSDLPRGQNGLRVRMGIHTQLDGAVQLHDIVSPLPVFDGSAVRIACIAYRAARGGEIVVSKSVADRVSHDGLNLVERSTVELCRDDAPGGDTTSVVLYSVVPSVLARRVEELVASSPVEYDLGRAPQHATSRSTPPVAVAVRVLDQAKLCRYGVESRRVLQALDQLVETSAVELGGCPAQRLPNFSGDDWRQATSLWVFPDHTHALEWAMNLQQDAMDIKVPSLLSCLDCCKRVVEGAGKVFHGLRLCIGMAPLHTDDFTLRKHPSPFSLGVLTEIHNESPFRTAAALCYAARGGETLALAAFVHNLQPHVLADCVASPEFQLRDDGPPVQVYQVFPQQLAARARHIPPLNFDFLRWRPHRKWRREMARTKRRTMESLERHWMRMQGSLVSLDPKVPRCLSKVSSSNSSRKLGSMGQNSSTASLSRMPGSPRSRSGFKHFHTELMASNRKHSTAQRKVERTLRTLETFCMLAEDTYLHDALAGGAGGAGTSGGSTQQRLLIDPVKLTQAVMDVPQYKKKSTCIFQEAEEDPDDGGGVQKLSECVKLTHKHIRIFSKLTQHYCDPLIDPNVEGMQDDEFMQLWMPGASLDSLGRYARKAEGGEDLGPQRLCSSMVGHCMALFAHLQTAVRAVQDRTRTRKRSVKRKASMLIHKSADDAPIASLPTLPDTMRPAADAATLRQVNSAVRLRRASMEPRNDVPTGTPLRSRRTASFHEKGRQQAAAKSTKLPSL